MDGYSRLITDHIVENDAANHQLHIEVTDAPGDGGACHRYVVTGFDNATNIAAAGDDPRCKVPIVFQNGPIPEKGVNGLTQEALIAIVIDRLRGFQSGQFACRENAIVLTHLEEALMWLQRRTRSRIARGVEGTHIR